MLHEYGCSRDAAAELVAHHAASASLGCGDSGWHVDNLKEFRGGIGILFFDYAQGRDFRENMVEAVGVEPTSENVTGQEPTYLVQFTRRELPRQIRVLRLERTRNAKR